MRYSILFWGEVYVIDARDAEDAAFKVLTGPAKERIDTIPEATDVIEGSPTKIGDGVEVHAWYADCGDGCCSGSYMLEVWEDETAEVS